MSLWRRLKSFFEPEAHETAPIPREDVAETPTPAPTPRPRRPKQVWPEGLRDVLLGPNGVMVGATPTVDAWIDPQGRPQSVCLARDTAVHGVPCAGGSTLSAVMNDVARMYQEILRLRPDGTVAFATLSDDARVDGVPLARRHTVARHANGRVQVGTLSRDWPHPLGCVAARGTLLGRFDDGSPSLLTLAEAFGEHPAGTVFRYASPGAPPRAEPASVPLGPVTPIVR